MLSGEDIFRLIPQRPPMVMVDTLYSADAATALTGLTIRQDNIFLTTVGGSLVFTEPGLIEHIAQSAAAFAGYGYYMQGEPPKLGFIGEIKKCKIYCLPAVGSALKTSLTVLGEAGGVTLMQARTTLDETLVAECQMKIFIKE